MHDACNPRIPSLSGCVCTALLVEESWFHGRCQHRFNAFYLQLNGKRWHRFRVSCGGVHWKVVDSPNHPLKLGWEFRLRAFEEADIVGKRIHKIEFWQREPFGYDPNDQVPIQFFDDSAIRLRFIDGFVLEVRYCWHDLALNFFPLEPRQAKRKLHYHRQESFPDAEEILIGTMNDDVRTRLEALDKEEASTVDLRNDEWGESSPGSFYSKAAVREWGEIEAIGKVLEPILKDRFAGIDKHFQDSRTLAALRFSRYFYFSFSGIGHLFTATADEDALYIDKSLKQGFEDAIAYIESLGYVYVSDDELNEPYTGSNPRYVGESWRWRFWGY